MNTQKIAFFLFVLLGILGCQKTKFKKKESEAKKLFTLIGDEQTNIDFNNSVKQDFNFNYIDYPYAFTGGGVAVGDFNNDGLQDIYFTANQKTNKLYLNKGDFSFEDATEKSRMQDDSGWTTGVSVIDINNDGWLDIYVCKSASAKENELRKNKLFINQKDGSFKDEAQRWGLDHNGFSIQSYFFDYDKDGDLDMYLVNHRLDFNNANKIESKKEREYFPEVSDHLFRNDGNSFTNVTLQSKIINKEWGLSASIGDFNNDGWQDIFVANDYIGPDYLYINNKDGTFSNQINTRFKHISYNSMGSDYADINNDFLPDLVVLDMSAEDHRRGKQNMASMNTQGFWKMVESGYHHTYMSNILQLNNGNGSFSDIGQLAGISKTDWSWAPIIADFDNDGHKDLFVSNGIERELGNQDYRKKVQDIQAKKGAMTVKEMMEIMPSENISNYAFKNNGDLTFDKVTREWGLDQKINSNGIAYADFDNDGDLDLVLNNSSGNAAVYKNNSTGNFINIKLKGDSKNINGIGTKVKVYTKNKKQYQELYTARGFQSSVSNVLNFGLGDETEIKRIEIIWPDDKVIAAENITANQTLTFDKKDFNFDGQLPVEAPKYFKAIHPGQLGIDFKHDENDFNDFSRQVLLPQKQSQQGPAFKVADVNGDGLDDLFFGGALNQPATLYIQNAQSRFIKTNQNAFQADRGHEDIGSLFFDADNDGDLDLYIASGGYELAENSRLLQDRLYLNNGKGIFSKSTLLPQITSSTKRVQAVDIDNDNDLDLVVAGHTVPGKYPMAPRSYLLQNDKGKFTDVTQTLAPDLEEIGIVNDLILSDYDNDGDKDLFIVGEWMPITVLQNSAGAFAKAKIESFKNSEGWWNTIKEVDLDQDGDMDYLVGNLGNNNKFHPSIEKPLHVYGNNFDDNETYDMVLSKIYNGELVPVRGKECSTEQNAFVSERIPTYKEFAASSLVDIYGKDKIEASYHKEVYNFSSVYVENKGEGKFVISKLPSIAQIGPTLSFELVDINKDGNLDILGVGGIHEAEVETVRYDSNTGYILLGNGKGDFEAIRDISFYNDHNAKAMATVNIGGIDMYVIANNDAVPSIFMLN